MKRLLLFLLCLTMLLGNLAANPVQQEYARQMAWKYATNNPLFQLRQSEDAVKPVHTFYDADGMATMFVFDIGDKGFVIIAADDCSHPVIGYSGEGVFDLEHAPDGFLYMMDEISHGISLAVADGVKASSDIRAEWENLCDYGVLHLERNGSFVEPLVLLKWDQSAPYNMFVPSGCPSGCVATALSQLMKYWEWPITGTGSHQYYCEGYGIQSANFGETTYDWAHMTPTYGTLSTQEEKVAVATLMYHCGVAMNMGYHPSGSGAYSADVPERVSTYFSYSTHTTFIEKHGYSSEHWTKMLKSYLDQKIPIYYSGYSTTGGHAFVCEGYDKDGLFYFNWGWGGSSNGYFLIDGPDFNYSDGQAVVVDMVPDYLYDQMPRQPEDLTVVIDDDVTLTGHISWINPSMSVVGNELQTLDKIVITRDGKVIAELTDVTPGAAMSFDDEVPYFDKFTYKVYGMNDKVCGRVSETEGVYGPYCDWSVVMTSTNFHGWSGGGITVQNAAGSYIDFLTTSVSTASIQHFQMALGNNNLYWKAPDETVNSMSFKVKSPDGQVVYEFSGASPQLEEGLLCTLNNQCGHENVCESPYHLVVVNDEEDPQTLLLTWNSDFDPEFGYCIYRDGQLIYMSRETSFVDEHTEIGGHCYMVTALCTGGETEPSNEVCVTSGEHCDAPRDLHFSYTATGKVMLEWNAPRQLSPNGYMVYRRTPGKQFQLIKVQNKTTFKDTSANPDVVYQYAVSSVYSDIPCYSGYAQSLFNPDKYYIEVNWSEQVGTLVAKVSDDATSMHLVWEAVYQSASYQVFKDGTLLATIEDGTCTFDDPDVAFGSTYCYYVKVIGAEGEIGQTNEVCVGLLCNAPTDLSARVEEETVFITWSRPADYVQSYRVIRTDNQTGEETVIEGVLEETYSEQVAGTYDLSFQVKANYGGCESALATTAEGEDFVKVTNLGVGEADANIRVYPNPTDGVLYILADSPCRCKVYDLVGQTVLETERHTIDLSGLADGVYLLKVSTANGVLVQKIIKK